MRALDHPAYLSLCLLETSKPPLVTCPLTTWPHAHLTLNLDLTALSLITSDPPYVHAGIILLPTVLRHLPCSVAWPLP